ncbi:f-box only protein 22 [Trichonephila clavipes]|nr:f-box only protein 22 [Trichonephila clavipes]
MSRFGGLSEERPSVFKTRLVEQLLNTDYFEGTVIAFSGPNVEAASIITNENDKKEEITAKFETFKETVIRTAFKGFLPDKCEVTFSVATGIVGSNADGVTMEIENGPSMTGIFIPKVEGVTINKCCLNKRNFRASAFIAQNAPMKALLVLSTSKGAITANNLIKSCCSDDGSLKMAVGGAIVERSECFVGSVVAFSGPNVEAGSIIININDKKEEITAKLETFKETGLLKHKCFAFMFACIARGYSFHLEHNVESSIFRKMYPNIPLIGLFGNGEVGYNYLPNFPMEKTLRAGSFGRHERKFLHGYTSVFVLISLKILSFEHHAGDSTILLDSNPISREHPGSGQEPPTYLPLQPPHEKTCGSTAKLKLDDRGCRRRLFPEGWEKKKDHDLKIYQYRKLPQKRGGMTYPKARAL